MIARGWIAEGLFDDVASRGSIGPHAPGGRTRIERVRKGDRLDARLPHRPAFAAGSRLVQLVTLVIQPRVDQQRSDLRRLEPEALDRGHAALFKNRALMPGFSPVAGDKEKRIARR